MAERGHEATASAFSAWATATTAAPPDVVREHLVRPDLLARWVPCVEEVVADGDALRMEVWIDPRTGRRVTFVTRSQTVEPLRVERAWVVTRITGRFSDQTVDTDVPTCTVTYTLTATGDRTAITVRVDTEAVGISTWVVGRVARSQARSLDRAVDRLARMAEGRRRSLVDRFRSTTAPGPL